METIAENLPKASTQKYVTYKVNPSRNIENNPLIYIL